MDFETPNEHISQATEVPFLSSAQPFQHQLGYTLSDTSIFFRVLASNILIYSKNIISIP